MSKLISRGSGSIFRVLSVLAGTAFPVLLSAQMITGVWKGKIGHQKVEIKIIQKGDSLRGTAYYYESPSNYRRYSLVGYFDPSTNAAVWWDDQLIDERSGRFSLLSPGKIPMLSRADFNCPGSGRMMLDGKTFPRDNELLVKGEVHLDKTDKPGFEDEWNYILENYTIGANEPWIIDSITAIASAPDPTEERIAVMEDDEKEPIRKSPQKPAKRPAQETPVRAEKPAPVITTANPVKAPDIVEKFTARQRTFIKEIPVSGDSIELRFYDNAEIDGDSISLFLNDKLLFEHIRLTANAWIIRIPVTELKETNELIMVAENLGAIPPNTSYMVAIVNEKRYDAYLASSEGSSAMIRLTKK